MLKKIGIATVIAALLLLVFWGLSTKGNVTASDGESTENTQNTESKDDADDAKAKDNTDDAENAEDAETKDDADSADTTEKKENTGNIVSKDESIIMIPAQGTLDTLIEDSLDDVLEEEQSIIICATPDSLAETLVVSSEAVFFMNGDGGTVYQGDVDENALKDLQLKLNQKNSLDETQLSAWDFYRMDALVDYQIPDGVTEINRFAFARSGLREIVIPEGVTDIRYAAFYHCDSLEKITIPSTVTNIEQYAFTYTPWLRDFYENSEEDFLIVGDGILLAYKGNETDVEIPEGVKVIAADAFSNPY